MQVERQNYNGRAEQFLVDKGNYFLRKELHLLLKKENKAFPRIFLLKFLDVILDLVNSQEDLILILKAGRGNLFLLNIQLVFQIDQASHSYFYFYYKSLQPLCRLTLVFPYCSSDGENLFLSYLS